MLPITEKFTNCTISSRGGTKIEWIVVHYFGGLGSALSCAGWFCNPKNKQGSADFCVDDDYIVQVNPDLTKYNTWHCGGGLQGYIRHGKFGICRNANSIGIEMRPYNDNGNVSAAQNAGWYFHQKTIDNTVDLVQHLMAKYNVDSEHVIMHADVTGKYCPAPFLDDITLWEDFLAGISGKAVSAIPAQKPVAQVQNPTTNKMYRVRKSWKNAKSQIGAFTAYENAVACADKNPGYTVYNNKGEAVYPMLEAFKIRVEIKDLRIRSGPGTNYASKGYIIPGVYTIVETKEAYGYLWGKLKSGVGWIALDYVRKI